MVTEVNTIQPMIMSNGVTTVRSSRDCEVLANLPWMICTPETPLLTCMNNLFPCFVMDAVTYSCWD